MKKIILLIAVFVLFTLKSQTQTVTDIDGNVYNTITIGTQTWMAENLKVTHYSNGIVIPNVTDNFAWYGLTTGARCYYNNDSINNAPVYGALYNWYTVDDPRNLCPTGWHVPTLTEWNILEKYLDITVDTSSLATGWTGTNIGGTLKETGIIHWNSPNTGATDSVGFNALPSGTKELMGPFNNIGLFFHCWTSKSDTTLPNAWVVGLTYNSSQILRGSSAESNGNPVRCIKDSPASIIENIKNDDIIIFPNPTNGAFTIRQPADGILQPAIYVYNSLGKLIYKKEKTAQESEVIDLSALSKGIYFIKVQNEEKFWTKKVILE